MKQAISFGILVAAMIVGLGAGEATAASHSSRSATNSTTSSTPTGFTGGDHWIRPDCLQPDVLVHTGRGVAWERKPECAS
jgi:hypothetical protein